MTTAIGGGVAGRPQRSRRARRSASSRMPPYCSARTVPEPTRITSARSRSTANRCSSAALPSPAERPSTVLPPSSDAIMLARTTGGRPRAVRPGVERRPAASARSRPRIGAASSSSAAGPPGDSATAGPPWRSMPRSGTSQVVVVSGSTPHPYHAGPGRRLGSRPVGSSVNPRVRDPAGRPRSRHRPRRADHRPGAAAAVRRRPVRDLPARRRTSRASRRPSTALSAFAERIATPPRKGLFRKSTPGGRRVLPGRRLRRRQDPSAGLALARRARAQGVRHLRRVHPPGRRARVRRDRPPAVRAPAAGRRRVRAGRSRRHHADDPAARPARPKPGCTWPRRRTRCRTSSARAGSPPRTSAARSTRCQHVSTRCGWTARTTGTPGWRRRRRRCPTRELAVAAARPAPAGVAAWTRSTR